MDIVINNISGEEDVAKKKSKNKIINGIVITIIAFLFAFGIALYNHKANKGNSYKSYSISHGVTETLYVLPTQSDQYDYVLNTNTMKAHKPDCKYVDNIDDKNRENYCGTIEDLHSKGYSSCGYCHAW